MVETIFGFRLNNKPPVETGGKHNPRFQPWGKAQSKDGNRFNGLCCYGKCLIKPLPPRNPTQHQNQRNGVENGQHLKLPGGNQFLFMF